MFGILYVDFDSLHSLFDYLFVYMLLFYFIFMFVVFFFFFFKQKPAYEMRISDWSSDVCSSDLAVADYLLAGGISPRSVVLDTHMTLMDGAGNGVLPTTIFVDAKGKIVATQVGEISRAALSDKLQQLQGD